MKKYKTIVHKKATFFMLLCIFLCVILGIKYTQTHFSKEKQNCTYGTYGTYVTNSIDKYSSLQTDVLRNIKEIRDGDGGMLAYQETVLKLHKNTQTFEVDIQECYGGGYQLTGTYSKNNTKLIMNYDQKQFDATTNQSLSFEEIQTNPGAYVYTGDPFPCGLQKNDFFELYSKE